MLKESYIKVSRGLKNYHADGIKDIIKGDIFCIVESGKEGNWRLATANPRKAAGKGWIVKSDLMPF